MISSPDGIDYYDAWYGRECTTVALGEEGRLELRRAGLGRHFALAKIAEELKAAALEDQVELLRRWLHLVGVDEDAPVSVVDLPSVVAAASELNQIRGQPAWRRIERKIEERKDKLSDYEGRELSHLVHLLAYHYGWTADYILALPVEVVYAHTQECILAQRAEREWSYYLSEIAWAYDKESGKSRYRPLPPIDWDAEVSTRKAYSPISDHVRERYFPKGVIIDLTDPETIKQLGQVAGRTADNEAP